MKKLKLSISNYASWKLSAPPSAYTYVSYRTVLGSISTKFLTLYSTACEPGSSVTIVFDYGLDDRAIRGSIPGRGKRIFPVASMSRRALGPIQSPVQWVPGVLSPGVKAGLGRDTDHSPPSSAEVENG
jgi:hypothetical protein